MTANSNLQQFQAELTKKEREIKDFIHRKMPIHAGRIGKSHFQDNFRKSGFVNNGLKKWKKSNRELHGGKSASANYKTLLSARDHLYSSIKYIPGDARVTIANDVPYPGIHNWGGTVSPTVTPKMRKFAWAKYYAASGGENEGTYLVTFPCTLFLLSKIVKNESISQRCFAGLHGLLS